MPVLQAVLTLSSCGMCMFEGLGQAAMHELLLAISVYMIDNGCHYMHLAACGLDSERSVSPVVGKSHTAS